MITKAAYLSRLRLNSSSYLLNKLIYSNIKSSHVSCIKTEKQITHLIRKISTSSYCFQNDSTDKKITTNSILSDDLKNILEKKVEEKSNETEEQPKPNSEDEKKSRFAKAFSREHGWKVTLALFGGIFVGGVFYTLFSWGAPNMDENNNPIKDQYSDMPLLTQYPTRAYHAVRNFYSAMKEPSTDKLLPEPLQYPYLQPTYTLVIEMTGLLLHPEWTFNTGWRYKKRPGLDYFLEQIKYPTFEVVLFTREPYLSGFPIVTNLDPENHIQFKLFRESTNLKNNHHVKDLEFMNRDLKKIIVIDWDENAYQSQPRNALHRLKKWDGDESDTDLVYLASFLKMIATSGVSDIREVLDYYNKELDPLDTFKLNQVKLHESEQKRKQEIEEMKNSKQKKAAFSFFRR